LRWGFVLENKFVKKIEKMKKIMHFFVTLLLILATENSVLGKNEMRCYPPVRTFYFKYNSIEIEPKSKKYMEEELAYLKKYDYFNASNPYQQDIYPDSQDHLDKLFYVYGHCSDGENKSIALKRAKKIKQMLVKMGVSPCHIGIISFENE
jgi:hypothetical protein